MYYFEEDQTQSPDLETNPLTDNHIVDLFGSLLDFDQEPGGECLALKEDDN